jgi:hypothetical protein
MSLNPEWKASSNFSASSRPSDIKTSGQSLPARHQKVPFFVQRQQKLGKAALSFISIRRTEQVIQLKTKGIYQRGSDTSYGIIFA